MTATTSKYRGRAPPPTRWPPSSPDRLRKRGELDCLVELREFADQLEWRATLATIEGQIHDR